jgi:hypothetical protein
MYNRFAMFRVAWVARGRFSCHIYQNNILLFNVAGEASPCHPSPCHLAQLEGMK